MIEGSRYFRRFVKEAQALSRHVHFVPISHGFFRIYWTGGGEPAYIHEVQKWMPFKSYEIEEKDIELVSQKYFEEYEDNFTASRKVKNFVEGYVDSINTIRTRIYMLKNNKAFREEATKAYRKVKVK